MRPEGSSKVCRNPRPRLNARWLAIGIIAFALFGVVGIGAAERAAPSTRQDAPFVCAQIVLAIDGSRSTGDGAFRRQIEAFRVAFNSERLYRALQDCLPGSVAFAVMTWSGANQQDLCRDWWIVTNRADSRHLVEYLEICRYFGGTTDIGHAVDYGLNLLERSPIASFYRAILMLTNGRTDRGAEASLSAARKEAATAAVTLAGHALLRPRPKSGSPFFVPDAVRLDRYVADRVSAGPRSFTGHSRPGDDIEALLRALVEMLRQETG